MHRLLRTTTGWRLGMPQRGVGSLLACIPVFVGAAACHGAATQAGSVSSVSAIVYGRVTTASGAPVSGAHVSSSGRQNGCGTEVVASGSPTMVLTDANGHYAQRIISGRSPFVACVQVLVVLATPQGADSVTVDSAMVHLSLDTATNMPPPDSVRVDAVIPQH